MSKTSFAEQAMVFSKSTHGTLYLTNNFQVKEFACSDGTDVIVIHPYIPAICQAVRNWFGYPYSPNSAYRTVSHNKSSGGANGSFHVYGKAVDIPACNGVTPKELYEFLDRLCGNSCEIGLYDWGVHVGICDTKKRFKDT